MNEEEKEKIGLLANLRHERSLLTTALNFMDSFDGKVSNEAYKEAEQNISKALLVIKNLLIEIGEKS